MSAGGSPNTAKGSAATTVTDTATGKITYAVEVGALPEAVVLSPDGSRRIDGEVAGNLDAAEALGDQLASQLLAQGARDLL